VSGFTPGPWRAAPGGRYGAVVSDVPVEGTVPSEGEREAYGGYLVAESIAPQDRPLIAVAPELLGALEWALPLLDLIRPVELVRRGIEAEQFEAMNERAKRAVASAQAEIGVSSRRGAWSGCRV